MVWEISLSPSVHVPTKERLWENIVRWWLTASQRDLARNWICEHLQSPQLWERNCYLSYTFYGILLTKKVGTIILSIIWKRKLRHREIKSFAWDHRARKWQGQNLNSVMTESILLTIYRASRCQVGKGMQVQRKHAMWRNHRGMTMILESQVNQAGTFKKSPIFLRAKESHWKGLRKGYDGENEAMDKM